MKALVIYDSTYGNTKLVAEAIGTELGLDVDALPASKANPTEVSSLDLLVVGSPVHGGRPSEAIQAFLKGIPAGALENVNVAAFDTRFAKKAHGIGLRVLMNVIGFAAGRIADSLKEKGGVLVAKPEGFIVEGKEGPMKEGELDRAAAWAKTLRSKMGK